MGFFPCLDGGPQCAGKRLHLCVVEPEQGTVPERVLGGVRFGAFLRTRQLLPDRGRKSASLSRFSARCPTWYSPPISPSPMSPAVRRALARSPQGPYSILSGSVPSQTNHPVRSSGPELAHLQRASCPGVSSFSILVSPPVQFRTCARRLGVGDALRALSSFPLRRVREGPRTRRPGSDEVSTAVGIGRGRASGTGGGPAEVVQGEGGGGRGSR